MELADEEKVKDNFTFIRIELPWYYSYSLLRDNPGRPSLKEVVSQGGATVTSPIGSDRRFFLPQGQSDKIYNDYLFIPISSYIVYIVTYHILIATMQCC